VPAGTARAVFLVGVQRSGTNMLVRGLERAPEVEVRNENDRTLFRRFRLRDDDVLVRTVRRSRHRVVLVKPLCDSHQVDRLLDLPDLPGGRALWAFREPHARARSEVARFGPANLRALQAIAAGDTAGRWQAARLDDDAVEAVRRLRPERLTPYEGALAFWAVRNGLWFTLGLDAREDCLLVDYDAVVADPLPAAERLCGFVGLPPRSDLLAHVVPRSTHHDDHPEVDPAVLDLVESTWSRLRAAAGTSS
jgi:hypothetical protein